MKKLFTLSMVLVLALCTSQAQVAVKHMSKRTLPIDQLDGVKFYSNEGYSQPGAYDYAFAFSSNSTDSEYGFPWLQFELFMPTAGALTAGTYSLAEENMQYIILIREVNDYYAYYYGYDPYDFQSGTVTLTDNGENNWTFDFNAVSAAGDEYAFSYTGNVSIEEDNSAPEGGDDGGDESRYTYQYEPTEATTMNIAFTTMDRYEGYIDEHGVLDIILDTDQTDANGHQYTCGLYLFTPTADVPSGTYPINSSGEPYSWQKSPGCSTTSNSLDYPCYVNTYDTSNVYDSWYMVSGSIAVSYDEAGRMLLDGQTKTYNGSTINFTYRPDTQEGIGTVVADQHPTATQKLLRHDGITLHQGHHRFNLQGVKF